MPQPDSKQCDFFAREEVQETSWSDQSNMLWDNPKDTIALSYESWEVEKLFWDHLTILTIWRKWIEKCLCYSSTSTQLELCRLGWFKRNQETNGNAFWRIRDPKYIHRFLGKYWLGINTSCRIKERRTMNRHSFLRPRDLYWFTCFAYLSSNRTSRKVDSAQPAQHIIARNQTRYPLWLLMLI